MKKHLFFKGLALCLTALVLFVLPACQQEEKTHFVLNGFESLQELFSIRPAVQLMDGQMDIISADSGPVKSGKGSARLFYEKGERPNLVLHIQQAAYPEMDAARICKMQLWVYNDNAQEVTCRMFAVNSRFEASQAQEFTLLPGQWNDLLLPITPGSIPADEFTGFGLIIDAPAKSQFYLDDWSVAIEN